MKGLKKEVAMLKSIRQVSVVQVFYVVYELIYFEI